VTSPLTAYGRLSRPERVLAVAWLAVVVMACTLVVAYPRGTHIDFVGFYCAGEAVTNHADPYRQMPLHGCEYRVTAEGGYRYLVTIPAPLPPYALVPFAILSRLPFVPAYILFTSLSFAALVAGGIVVGRITGASAALVIAAIAPSAWDNLVKGQPVPFVFLAILVAGYAVRCGRPQLAVIAAAATMLEPHIGLPVCIALFIGEPRTRGTLAATALALGGISVAVLSAPITWEYVRHVLPLHAASEANWVAQLSLVSPLMLFGASQQAAVTVATAQYLVTVGLGIAVATSVAKRLNAPQCLTLIPPLFAVLGGPYVHYNLLLVAIPAAVLAASRLRMGMTYVALGGVAFSWLALDLVVPLLIVIASAYTIGYAWRPRLEIAVFVVTAVSLSAILLNLLNSPSSAKPVASQVAATAYAEESWAAYVHAENPSMEGQRAAFVLKIPTWSGLLIFSATFGLLGSREPRRGRSAPLSLSESC
jgi:hypothetical protein